MTGDGLNKGSCHMLAIMVHGAGTVSINTKSLILDAHNNVCVVDIFSGALYDGPDFPMALLILAYFKMRNAVFLLVRLPLLEGSWRKIFFNIV